ncbi:hypothetical protein KC354_g113 [Hortaea werneckii]|nr:hypothetical protein KC354_g113 [Hortaea werneckii]
MGNPQHSPRNLRSYPPSRSPKGMPSPWPPDAPSPRAASRRHPPNHPGALCWACLLPPRPAGNSRSGALIVLMSSSAAARNPLKALSTLLLCTLASCLSTGLGMAAR